MAKAFGIGGCGATGVSTNTVTETSDYTSPGGTSGLDLGESDTGSTTLKAFDPGAFIRASSASASLEDDPLDAAEFDITGSEPPPADEPSPPPDEPPPPDGELLVLDGEETLLTDDEFVLIDGEEPPPPDDEFFFTQEEFFFTEEEFFFIHPDDFDGELPPPPDDFFFDEALFLTLDFDGTFVFAPPEGGFVGDGGFFAPPEGFHPDGTFFIPPEGFVGDAIFLPPPPEFFDGEGFFFPPSGEFGSRTGFEAPADFFEVYNGFPPPPPGFEGEWQPPPSEWDGSGDWTPPPAEHLYVDGAWYPPPPPPGWHGDWFAPPPAPEGMDLFPQDFFFSDKFDDFFDEAFFIDEGFAGAPPPFEEFPFEDFFANHSILDIIPGAPPEFEHGVAFGAFQFGDVPPPPPGFPPFPPPPDFLGEFGDFGAAFGPPPGDFPDGLPPGPIPVLPPEFFEFKEQLDELHAFLEEFDFPPPPDGEFPSGDLPFFPDGPPQLGGIEFDQIADLLPPGFLPPEGAIAAFENFGRDHPLVGDGGVVNPDLERALDEHPPAPEGFEAFDFEGDRPQFDDLFTVYDEESIGETARGQVNTTANVILEDGTPMHRSNTTVLECVQEEALPLAEMAPGVFQTQWVVNVRCLTNMVVDLGDPNDPEGITQFEQTIEELSQVTWTMIMQEVDTDGDGIPDEVLMSGSSVVDVLGTTVTGGPPEGTPPLPPPPPLVLPFDFEGVLETSGTE